MFERIKQFITYIKLRFYLDVLNREIIMEKYLDTGEKILIRFRKDEDVYMLRRDYDLYMATEEGKLFEKDVKEEGGKIIILY